MEHNVLRGRTTFRAIRALVPFALLTLAAVFVWVGIQRGELRLVLNKAIRICLECVGLG
ncbi:MAG: hypothetical protein K2K67_06385 [Treponemataceae bacterium]|nr:hypothetical protein [Treponemataceae bacterium]